MVGALRKAAKLEETNSTAKNTVTIFTLFLFGLSIFVYSKFAFFSTVILLHLAGKS
jgi:hypothetical protein